MSKDKRITLNQAISMTNEAYEHLEVIALATAGRVLKQHFGFGPSRQSKFRVEFIAAFKEEAMKYAESQRKQMRRRF